METLIDILSIYETYCGIRDITFGKRRSLGGAVVAEIVYSILFYFRSFDGGAALAEWLEDCVVNLQVLSSNPTRTCVCGMFA